MSKSTSLLCHNFFRVTLVPELMKRECQSIFHWRASSTKLLCQQSCVLMVLPGTTQRHLSSIVSAHIKSMDGWSVSTWTWVDLETNKRLGRVEVDEGLMCMHIRKCAGAHRRQAGARLSRCAQNVVNIYVCAVNNLILWGSMQEAPLGIT